MINPLFLPQNARKKKKTTMEQTPQNTSVRRQFKLIHQLDCIYQGEVNHSYQKQGFGIQQTNDFYMYIGFWKCNKTNGLGMIVYPEGGLIYGYFRENQMSGLAITDNKKRLRIGIFQNSQIIGIGFQYNYADTKWKFCRFHRGISIQTISQVVSPLEKGPPSMMNLHEDMHILLSKYLSQQFFDIPVKTLVERPYKSYTEMNVHKIDANYLYFGQVIDGKYWGLGCIYDKIHGYPIQIGYYQTGALNGYGFKFDKDKFQIEMGLYTKGKKQGFFFEKRNRLETIVEYQQNYCKGQSLQMTRQKLKAIQKIYNYQKNDFFSQKNKINFRNLRHHLDHDNNKELSKLNQTLKNIGTKSKDKDDKKKSQKDSSPKAKKAQPNKYLNEINISKSTVQVIREKLGDIENLIKRSKAIVKEDKQKKDAKKDSPKKNRFLEVDTAGLNSLDMKFKGVDDDQIHQEQIPVSTNYDLSEFYRDKKRKAAESPRSRSPLTSRTPKSPRKLPANNTTSRKQQRSPETYGREQANQYFYFYEPKTNEFALSPRKNDRSVSASRKVKRRIFE